MSRLCLNAIVRNESARILRMLDSVKPVISTFAIMDTGSTDNTVELITQWGLDNDIPGIVGHGSFIDFSQARNQALDLARSWHRLKKAPWFDYLLLVDADMELEIITPALAFTALTGGEAYEMVQKAGTYSYNNMRLLNINSAANYVGVTHEFLNAHSAGVIVGAHFIDHADGANRPEKFTRDIRLLEKDLETDPNNGRSWFYLGNTYRDAGKHQEAELCYRKKLTLPTWPEEDWLTQVNVANCMEAQGVEDAYIKEALTAYGMRPQRAEPLHALAKHYRLKGQNSTAILFAEKGLAMPRPDDKLFVEDWVYDWGFREEFSIAGYYQPETRARAYEVTNSLALDPKVPDWLRYNSRRNLVHYLRPLKEFCPSYRDQEIQFTPNDGFTAMNPCVTNRPDGSLEVLLRTVNYTINDQGQYMIGPKGCWDAPIETENWLLGLGSDLQPLWGHAVRWDRPEPKFNMVIGLEDMRIFWANGERQFVACVREHPESGMPQMVRGTLSCGLAPGADVTAWTSLSDGSACEKNWAPVVSAFDGHAFMYRLDTVITDGRMEKRPCHLAVENISGGSQYIPFFGGYLSVVHEAIAHPSHGRRIYQHRFAYLDASLTLQSLSMPFVFHEVQIEFAAGLARDAEDNLVISFGERDAKAWLAVVDAGEVAGMLGL
jgi:tetratricopeptide (TPR) repeat protein